MSVDLNLGKYGSGLYLDNVTCQLLGELPQKSIERVVTNNIFPVFF
jgi:hypothetical protein